MYYFLGNVPKSIYKWPAAIIVADHPSPKGIDCCFTSLFRFLPFFLFSVLLLSKWRTYMYKKYFLVASFLLAFCSFAFASVQSPFQPLKDLSHLIAQFDFYTRFIVFFFSLGILVIAAIAYKRTKSRRMLLIAGAFFLFAAKWGIKIMDLYFSPGFFFPDASENIVELVILLLLLIALFKK